MARPVALVTGAARGIGKACALALAEGGFDLVLCDLGHAESRAQLDAAFRAVTEAGGSAAVVTADVGDLAQHAAMVAAPFEHFGRLDCLVNNAGVGVMQRGDLLDVSPESFDRCLRVNTRAMFFLCQAVARRMLEQGEVEDAHRSIINITSSNAVAVSIKRGEYCVSKAAASMTTQLFALRLADTGIGVYEVRPGVIETDMTRPAKAEYEERIAAGLVPAKRWGYPADVAASVLALAQGKLPYTVGQALTVDGGLIMPRF
jgi:3-oxoacyl-[acyl-carrier protein] reductase